VAVEYSQVIRFKDSEVLHRGVAMEFERRADTGAELFALISELTQEGVISRHHPRR
jgi:hypothetical protein